MTAISAVRHSACWLCGCRRSPTHRSLAPSPVIAQARRNAVEQCGLVRMALCGEGGAGGVTDALRTIEAQLNAILAQEEQNREAAKGAKGGWGSGWMACVGVRRGV